jgi:hypothetical protein
MRCSDPETHRQHTASPVIGLSRTRDRGTTTPRQRSSVNDYDFQQDPSCWVLRREHEDLAARGPAVEDTQPSPGVLGDAP